MTPKTGKPEPKQSTSEEPTTPPPGDGPDQARSPDEIRAEIEETREDLGETVAALAEKTDVKARAKEKVETAKEQAQSKVTDATEAAKQKLAAAPEPIRENPVPLLVGAGVAIGFAFWLLRRH
jgi:ElaB/YqjD/DUF883 family membrane-anchored ribosome-binding protein